MEHAKAQQNLGRKFLTELLVQTFDLQHSEMTDLFS